MNLKIRLLSKARPTALLALALALFTLTAGCNKESNTGNSSESARSDNLPANASPASEHSFDCEHITCGRETGRSLSHGGR
jgi:hypothetical protein